MSNLDSLRGGYRKTLIALLKGNEGSQQPPEQIEVTEWLNGGGVDVHLSNGDKTFSVSYDDLEVISELVSRLKLDSSG